LEKVKYIIQITRGEETGKTYPLDKKRITIGRKSGNTIVLSDIKVSGVHAEIIFEGGKPVIRDLGSTNGTYLEGNKIDEMILSEKDKITVGETHFILLKEGETAAAPPSEEAVRVIHDVRPVRRGMGGIVLLLILLLGLGGAAYYYFFHMASDSAIEVVDAAPGNLLAGGWSFEETGSAEDIEDLWKFEGGAGADATRTKRDARSGAYCIRMVMPDGGRAHGLYLEPIQVKPRRQYRGAAWVKIKGSFMVALKADFYRSAPDQGGRQILYTDEFASGREEGTDYYRIEGTVVPPPEAEEMELRIVAAGAGSGAVDDVELFEESATQPEQLGSSGVMDFHACQDGFLMRRIGQTLFLGGRTIALETGPEGEILQYDSDGAGFTIGGEGYLFCGARAGLIRVTRGLEVNAEKIEGSLEMPTMEGKAVREVRYCFDLLPEYAQHGVGIMSGEEFSLYGTAFPPVTAAALIFGGSHDRVKVAFERPVQVSGTARKDGGTSLACHFDPASGVRFTYRIQSDFTEETRQAQALMQQARRADQDECYGEALALIDQILSRYPYNETLMDHAQKLRAAIVEKKKLWLDEIQERLKSAQFLNTPALFHALEETCRRRLECYPEDKDFLAALKEVREKGSALLIGIRDERAERYYRIAKNLFDTKVRETTFSEILAYMESRFPESEWTKKARSLHEEGSNKAGPTEGSGE
jgi:hypothetical protein